MNDFTTLLIDTRARWENRHDNNTYCMRPVKTDLVLSTDQTQSFIVVGGQQLDESGERLEYHAVSGIVGLIVLTPNASNLGVVATMRSINISDLTDGHLSKTLGPKRAGKIARDRFIAHICKLAPTV
jgi:hypothetical protein